MYVYTIYIHTWSSCGMRVWRHSWMSWYNIGICTSLSALNMQLRPWNIELYYDRGFGNRYNFDLLFITSTIPLCCLVTSFLWNHNRVTLQLRWILLLPEFCLPLSLKTSPAVSLRQLPQDEGQHYLKAREAKCSRAKLPQAWMQRDEIRLLSELWSSLHFTLVTFIIWKMISKYLKSPRY